MELWVDAVLTLGLSRSNLKTLVKCVQSRYIYFFSSHIIWDMFDFVVLFFCLFFSINLAKYKHSYLQLPRKSFKKSFGLRFPHLQEGNLALVLTFISKTR